MDLAGGYTIGDVTAAFPVTVDHGGLASRGIYLVSPTLPQSQWPPNELQQLAGQINGYHGVDYAEENLPVRLADTEFYAWPYGPPSPDGKLPKTFTHQPAAAALQLPAAHEQSQGRRCHRRRAGHRRRPGTRIARPAAAKGGTTSRTTPTPAMWPARRAMLPSGTAPSWPA